MKTYELVKIDSRLIHASSVLAILTISSKDYRSETTKTYRDLSEREDYDKMTFN